MADPTTARRTRSVIDDSANRLNKDRIDYRQGAKPGSGVEEFKPMDGKPPRGRVTQPVNPSRSTGNQAAAKAKAAQAQKAKAKVRTVKAKQDPVKKAVRTRPNEPNGKAVGWRRQGQPAKTPKSPGPETAAVRQKYAGALDMRKEAAAGKGAKGKADLIAWKRASGYQADWNKAKANDTAASSSNKRPTAMPMKPMPERSKGPAGTQHTLPSTRGSDMADRIKAAGLAPKTAPKTPPKSMTPKPKAKTK